MNHGSMPGIPCTGCGSCRGCPMEIRIPEIFVHLNAYFASGATEKLDPIRQLPGDQQPKACVGCGQCNALCPEQIDIAGWMLKGSGLLEKIRG